MNDLLPMVAAIAEQTEVILTLSACGNGQNHSFELRFFDYADRRESLEAILERDPSKGLANDKVRMVLAIDGIQRVCGEAHYVTNGEPPSRIYGGFIVGAQEATPALRKRCVAVMLLRQHGLSIGKPYDDGSMPPNADSQTALTGEETLFLWMLYHIPPGSSEAQARAIATSMFERMRQQR